MINYVYISTNLINGKQYIGSHYGKINDSYLGSGRILLKAIKKYGNKNFKRKILEVCDSSLTLILEEKYIKEFDTLIPNGYNISPSGGHGLGGRLSEETKRKLRKPKSKQARENMSKGKMGIIFSEEHKENIRKSKTGENNPNYGKPRDKEIIEKIKESNIGQKRSEVTKQKIGNIHRGKIISNKHKEAIRAFHTGRKRSPETCKKIRLKALEREDKKRKERNAIKSN